ncbi:hypothetical protein [Streptomyces sp. NPDC058486]|uniref:hypothetical protein n=1 Tax=unclassified Streptomyces TaxID=2593676 RepID=UPI003659B2A3
MSAPPGGHRARVGRNYTKARTHPWVLGRLGDFVLWFGPYNAGQLVITAVGVLLLIKTFSWWSGPLGPTPVLALGTLVWAARAQRIGGRSPMWVFHGLLRRSVQPASGRIGGRTAHPPRAHGMTGTVLIERTDEPEVPTGSTGCTGSTGRTVATGPIGFLRSGRCFVSVSVAGEGPVPTPLQRLLRDRSKAKAVAR